MFEVKSILRKVTRKELVLGILLMMFWGLLQFYVQYAAMAFPIVAGLIIIISVLDKHKEVNDRRLIGRDQSEDIKKAYEKMNHVAHEFRAPLAGLKMACEQLSLDPGNQELVLAMAKSFPKQVDKLLLLTAEISKCSRELSQEVK